MKRSNRCATKLTLFAALVVLALLAPIAIARPAPRVVQSKMLIANKTARSWVSTTVGGTVFIHVFDEAGELEQHYVSPCRASYKDGGVRVLVRLRGCHAGGTDHPFVLTYRSADGPTTLTVVLSTGN